VTAPSQFSLQVTAVPVLTYAMARNRIGILGPVRITGSASPAAASPDPATQQPVAAAIRVEVDGPAGSLGHAEARVELPAPGGGTTLPSMPSPLDPAALAGLTHQGPGQVRVSLLVDGVPADEHTLPVRVLAARQWAPQPVMLGLEMLASHVMPQDPALTGLLEQVAERLAASAGSNAVRGYRDGPERARAVAEMVLEQVRSRGIHRQDPPTDWAGWADPAVRPDLRTPGEVLAGGTGSDLDIALLLAAALERAGLHPLIWLTGRSAFTGYWCEQRWLPASAVTDVDGVLNLVDLGLIGLDRDPSGPPADPADVIGVLDVASARRDGILPLPVTVSGPDGALRSIEYDPPDPAGAGSPVTPAPAGDRARPRVIEPAAGPERREVPPRVTQWKNALLDLSLRNRLLNYSGRGAVNLAAPPGLLGALEDTINSGGAISLLPSDQVPDVQARRGIRFGRELTAEQRADLLATRHAAYTDIPTEGYESRMRSLVYRARTIAEETGANNLYLALGTLVWSLDGRDLRSPVVLVPVTLSARSRHGGYRIELDEAGTSTPNSCLLEKLRQVHGLAVPGLAEPTEDSAGIDLDAAFRALRRALADAGLNHRVEQTADVALLAFAKFRLWKDLDEHWADLARNPLVSHLISAPTTVFADPVTEPADTPDLDALARQVPIPADASQLEVIAAASAGQTFVLEGPPGTGKSQTITNLLARAVAEGRRVLFVAEKRAALDVVTRRLEAIGLAPFCLDLHDKGAKPAVVRAQIKATLELRTAADQQGLAAATEQMRANGAQLARYAERLHHPNPAGLSYYSAHTLALAVGDGPVLPVPESVAAATDADLAAVRLALAGLPDVADPARPAPDHPWGFVDPPDPAAADPAALAAAAHQVDAVIDFSVRTPELAAALAAARTPFDVAALARFAAGWAVDLALLDEAAGDRWRRAAAEARAAVTAFAAATHPGLEVVTPDVFGLPVNAIDADAKAAAASSWFGRKKRQLAVLARLQPALRPGAAVGRKQLAELTGRLAGVWDELVALQVRVGAVPGLAPPDGWNPLTPAGQRWLDDRVQWLSWASDAAALRDRSGRALADPGPFRLALRHLLESRAIIGLDDKEALDRLSSALNTLAGMAGGDAPFAGWSASGLLKTWRATHGRRRAGEPGQPVLRRWLALLTQVQPLRAVELHRARSLLLSGAIPAGDAARAFEAGLAAAALAERGAATGLDGFEPTAHDRAVRRFADAAQTVRRQLASAIPAAVLAGRSFDAASGFGQVGELGRELAKQRRGLAVRPLLARYGDLITAVMPCMLVSPDSLARFFPPQANLFDLVVFDEASQIRVADAIGALGRARSAVVVGDSQQMPPTSVAESVADPVLEGSAGDDSGSDLLGVPDEESILSECVQAGVRRRWLSWHYRSQDEALIAFSNRRYYDDALSTFPSPLFGTADPGVHGHGISLIRVPGQFLRSGAGKLLRTNPTEAAAVVSEIRRRFDAAGPGAVPSIGVVTFNAPQRTLIESLLRDLEDERITDALDRTDGEGLFVKNLENVQGDERDVILFSTAFSANARGVLPLNFGPLNQIGGQRRLNVAITRARRQVVVFSSFDPEDLRAEETTSQGIKDLRMYLEVARAGADTVVGTSPKAPAPDRHRDEVAAALRARGLQVATNVGLSDFRVDLAIGSRVAVLLDGPEWAARGTVGDRDGLPLEVLSQLMRWPSVQRVWLPDWLRDRESVLDRLTAAALGHGAGPDHEAAPDTPAARAAQGAPAASGAPGAPEAPDRGAMSASPTAPLPRAAPASDDGRSAATVPLRRIGPEPAQPGSGRALPGESPFTPWISGYLGDRYVLDRLPAPSAAGQVVRALHAAIRAEGPVHVDRLAKLVAGGFDLGRVSAERRQSILDCLPGSVFRDPLDPQFAWPDDLDPRAWTGFRRTGPDTDRPLEQVCAVEIGNAMVAICVAGAGAERDQLEVEALHVFGLRRRTTAALSVLQAALHRAIAEGRLVDDGGIYRVA
jgi:hypothetical protein